MAAKMDLKCEVSVLAWKRGWTLKYLKTTFNDDRLQSELLMQRIMVVSVLKTYLLSS